MKYKKKNVRKKSLKKKNENRRQKHKGEREILNNQKTKDKMAVLTHLSIITLNINVLNSPVKRHRRPGWIKSQHYPVSWILTSALKTNMGSG